MKKGIIDKQRVITLYTFESLSGFWIQLNKSVWTHGFVQSLFLVIWLNQTKGCFPLIVLIFCPDNYKKLMTICTNFALILYWFPFLFLPSFSYLGGGSSPPPSPLGRNSYYDATRNIEDIIHMHPTVYRFSLWRGDLIWRSSGVDPEIPSGRG